MLQNIKRKSCGYLFARGLDKGPCLRLDKNQKNSLWWNTRLRMVFWGWTKTRKTPDAFLSLTACCSALPSLYESKLSLTRKFSRHGITQASLVLLIWLIENFQQSVQITSTVSLTRHSENHRAINQPTAINQPCGLRHITQNLAPKTFIRLRQWTGHAEWLRLLMPRTDLRSL